MTKKDHDHFIMTAKQKETLTPILKQLGERIRDSLTHAEHAFQERPKNPPTDAMVLAIIFGRKFDLEYEYQVCRRTLNCLPTIMRDIADMYDDAIDKLDCRQADVDITKIAKE